LEQEDCYSVGDEDEDDDDDLDGFIVNDDEELEQAEESSDGKCLDWNYAGDGRIRDTVQRLIFVSSFFIPTDSSSIDEDSIVISVDDSEDDDIVKDEELEQAEESSGGKCLDWNSAGDGRIRDILHRGSFSFLLFSFQQTCRLMKTQSSSVVMIAKMTTM
jgi:uncharacterized protein YacL